MHKKSWFYYFSKAHLSSFGIIIFLGILAIIGTLIGFLGKFWWIFELTTNFRVQYSLALILVIICCCIRKYFKITGIYLVVLLLNLSCIIPLYITNSINIVEHKAGKKDLKILMINLMTGNINSSKVLNYIKEVQPDIMVLLETDVTWCNILSELNKDYPYSVAHPNDDNYGISLFSKYPIKFYEILDFSDTETPSIWTEVDINNSTIGILGTHTTPPIGSFFYECRNRHFKNMAEFVKNKKIPVIVTGDLNITPWATHFIKLKLDSGLKDCRIGSGIKPTWPVHFYPLLIPIDYCLCSKEIIIKKFTIGPDIGSDHFPIITEIKFGNTGVGVGDQVRREKVN